MLHLDKGKQSEVVTEAVCVCLATFYNVHGRFLKDRLGALEEKPRPGQPRKVTPEMKVAVTRITCSAGGAVARQPHYPKPRLVLRKPACRTGQGACPRSTSISPQSTGVGSIWQR
ncbi:helix-turn-helix domain-containing protein [Pontibacter sp. CAU 1760]